MNKQQKIIGISLAVLVLVFVLAAQLYKSSKGKHYEQIANEQSDVFIRPHTPVLGNEKAVVHLVEFLDPECESCRAFYPFVKQLMADYPGKIRLYIRYTPFHPNSKFAVRILEAARKQGQFWKTLELLFYYLPQWGSHHNPQPELIWDYLPTIGLDVEKIRKDMNDAEIDEIIAQDEADGKTLDVRKTPTFFVNGKPLPSFGHQQLRDAIERAINDNKKGD